MALTKTVDHVAQRDRYARFSRWTTIITWLGSLVTVVLIILINVAGSGSTASHHSTRTNQNSNNGSQTQAVNGQAYPILEFGLQHHSGPDVVSTNYSVYLNAMCYTIQTVNSSFSTSGHTTSLCKSLLPGQTPISLQALIDMTSSVSSKSPLFTDNSPLHTLQTTPTFALYITSLILTSTLLLLNIISTVLHVSPWFTIRIPTQIRLPLLFTLSTTSFILLIVGSGLISNSTAHFLTYLHTLEFDPENLSSPSESSQSQFQTIQSASAGSNFQALIWTIVSAMGVVSLSTCIEWLVLGTGLVREEQEAELRRVVEEQDDEEEMVKVKVAKEVRVEPATFGKEISVPSKV